MNVNFMDTREPLRGSGLVMQSSQDSSRGEQEDARAPGDQVFLHGDLSCNVLVCVKHDSWSSGRRSSRRRRSRSKSTTLLLDRSGYIINNLVDENIMIYDFDEVRILFVSISAIICFLYFYDSLCHS